MSCSEQFLVFESLFYDTKMTRVQVSHLLGLFQHQERPGVGLATWLGEAKVPGQSVCPMCPWNHGNNKSPRIL